MVNGWSLYEFCTCHSVCLLEAMMIFLPFQSRPQLLSVHFLAKSMVLNRLAFISMWSIDLGKSFRTCKLTVFHFPRISQAISAYQSSKTHQLKWCYWAQGTFLDYFFERFHAWQSWCIKETNFSSHFRKHEGIVETLDCKSLS